MARIAGVDLPNNKRVEIGLTYIYGIGLTTSKKILEDTGIDPDVRVKDLTEEDISKLREYIDQNLEVEGDRRRTVALDIKVYLLLISSCLLRFSSDPCVYERLS